MNDGTTANTLRLGLLVKEYKRSPARAIKLIILTVICLAVAAFLLGAAVFSTGDSASNRNGAAIIGLFFLLAAVFIVLMLFLQRGASLGLYENGLVSRKGGKSSMTTWDEIDSYMEETACRIIKKDGAVIEFGLAGIKDGDEVTQKIQAETLGRMLPQMKAAIAQGSSVQFKGWQPAGKIPLGTALDTFMGAAAGFTVDAQGIAENGGGQRIAWKDVTDCGVCEGKMGRAPVNLFFIQDANTSFRTRLGLLNNAHVLLTLCGEMVSLHQNEQPR